jgi:hypothetical protein
MDEKEILNKRRFSVVDDAKRKLQEDYEYRLKHPLPDTSIRPQSKEESKIGLGKILIAFVILAAAAFGIYQFIANEKSSQLKQVALEQEISNMVARHSAITDWKNSYKDLEEIYSSDMAEALHIKDQKPILINGEISDITYKDNKYYISFEDSEASYFLECTPEQYKIFLDNRDKGKEYSLIASFSDVRKKSVGEKDDYSTEFIAHGRCLDLLFLDS